MSDKNSKETDAPEVIEGEIVEEGETVAGREKTTGRKLRRGLIGFILLIVVLGAVYLWARAAGWLPNFIGGEAPPVTAEAPAQPAVDPARVDSLAERLSQAQSQNAELTTRLADLERRVDSLESAPAAASTAAPAENGEPAAAPEGEAQAVSELEDRIRALEAALRDRPAAQPGEAETADMTGLEDALNTLEARLAALEAGSRQRADFAANAARVGVAVYSGRPFEAETIALRDAARGLSAVDQAIAGPHIAALVELAPQGTRSLAALTVEFDRLAVEALRAEAGGEADEGFWAGVKARMSELITIRRRDGAAADSTEAILASIADALERGDPEAALGEANALEGPAAEALAGFTSELERSVRARQAVDALIALSESDAGRKGSSDSP